MSSALEEKSIASTTPHPTPGGSFVGEVRNTDADAEAAVDDGSKREAPSVQDEGADEVEYASGLRLGFIVVALGLSIFLVSLDMTIVATAIPKITDEFHGLDFVSWIGAAFFLCLAAFQSTWGKAFKYFDLKTTFLVAVFIFELGSLICGVAPSSTALIVGRAIAGMGGAGIASGAYTIIGFGVRPELRAAFTGILGAAYGVASVVGPLLGGVFSDKATWRWCFYINLPIGGIAGLVILVFFQTPPTAVPVKAPLTEKLLQMDPIGTFTIMAAVVCYILALQWGGTTKSWNDSSVIGTLVGFFLIAAFFVAVQWWNGERALIVGRLLRKRTIAVGMAYVFFFAGSFFVLLYYLPIYFQVVSDVSPSESGIRNLPLLLGTVVATILSGILITTFGHFVPMMILGGVGATIASGLIYTLNTNSSSGQWIGFQVLAGLAVGVALQVPVISAQGTSEPSDLSAATAMILFAQTLGGAFFVSAAQTIFANVMLQKLAIYVPDLDPSEILGVGATEIRNSFPAADVPGIVHGYMDGLQAAYALTIGTAGVSTVISLASRWRTLKGVNTAAAV